MTLDHLIVFFTTTHYKHFPIVSTLWDNGVGVVCMYVFMHVHVCMHQCMYISVDIIYIMHACLIHTHTCMYAIIIFIKLHFFISLNGLVRCPDLPH